MTTRRIAPAVVIGLLACSAPAAADAATLIPDKPCYGGGDTLTLTGTGYTPGGSVNVATAGKTVGTIPADAATTKTPGAIEGTRLVPYLTGKTTSQTDTYTATDATNPALTATAKVKRAKTQIVISPKGADAYGTLRIAASGFTAGKTLYRHAVLGKKVITRRQGALKGSCNSGSYREKLFTTKNKLGTYRVQWDTSKTYRRKTLQQDAYNVKLFRKAKDSSASAAATTWTPAG